MDVPSPTSPTFEAPQVVPDLVAFVADTDTEAVLKDVAETGNFASTKIARGTVADAIAFLRTAARGPKRLVVDVSKSALPLTEIDALAEACEPGVSVVVIGESHDIGLFRQLMKLGVSDYMAKPLTVELARQAVQPDADGPSRGRSRTGRTVVVTGARGGVGATSIATALARNLAEGAHRHVVMVDLDPFGGAASLQLGVEPSGLMDALANAHRLDPVYLDRILVPVEQRLFLLGAQEDLVADKSLDVEALESLVTALERQFHYVVVDLPRRPGHVYGWALQRAAVRVLVCDRTVPAVRDLKRLLELCGSGGGRCVTVLNDDQPASPHRLTRALLEEGLDRAIDLEIAYDAAAVSRLDNLGEANGGKSGPFALGVAELSASLVGLPPRKRRGWRWWPGK